EEDLNKIANLTIEEIHKLKDKLNIYYIPDDPVLFLKAKGEDLMRSFFSEIKILYYSNNWEIIIDFFNEINNKYISEINQKYQNNTIKYFLNLDKNIQLKLIEEYNKFIENEEKDERF